MNNIKNRFKDMVTGLIYVYGPIHIGYLFDKINHYFKDDIKKKDKDILYEAMQEVIDEKLYEDDDFVSFFDEEKLDEFFSHDPVRYFQQLDLEKEFKDKQEILNYADMLNVLNNVHLEKIKEFLNNFKFKSDSKKQEALNDIQRSAFYFASDEHLYKTVQKLCEDKIPKEKFLDLFSDFVLNIPRGFLNGYSMIELGEILKVPALKDNRIKLTKNYRKSKKYSYQQCIDLALKLKETDLFVGFCSDNIIELYIDKQPFYLQPLGYYNNDRNIIFYGDKQNLYYNYQFILTDDSYPDIGSRLKYCEISFDNYMGFLTDELDSQLTKKGYGKDPLIFELDPCKGPQVISGEQLNNIGNALESLLSIQETLKDETYINCEEGNSQLIIQLYLKENGEVEIGYYEDPLVGTTCFPFVCYPLPDIKTKAKTKTEIAIGIYSIKVIDEERPPYLVVIYNKTDDLIISGLPVAHDEMGDLPERIVNELETADIRPTEIVFNNNFSYTLLKDLLNLYNIDETYVFIENEKLDELYFMFEDHEFMDDDDEEVIH